jgi:hypothetical protein|nr:MAG TPA: Protein of unknown function (DUF3486) [Caudoviricetes sp.]
MAANSITTLPPALLEQLQGWLRDPAITQLEATDRLNAVLMELGEKPRSKSAVNRYALKMSEVGAKIQQSREIADMWIARFGNAPQGKVGALLNELVRNLAFETALQLSEDEEPAHPGLLKELAQAIEKLERASTINEQRQQEIEARALAKAAKAMEAEAARQGISDDTIATLKAKFLGSAA